MIVVRADALAAPRSCASMSSREDRARRVERRRLLRATRVIKDRVMRGRRRRRAWRLRGER